MHNENSDPTQTQISWLFCGLGTWLDTLIYIHLGLSEPVTIILLCSKCQAPFISIDMSFQRSAKVFCFGYCSHWLWDQAETSSKVISKLKCSISYLEPLVLNEVSGVPSAELLKLQWKTSFLGLETTSQGNSAFSIRATPTICGSSEPQYGESEITLCIHEVNWIPYISQEVTRFTSDILISVWNMYRQEQTRYPTTQD